MQQEGPLDLVARIVSSFRSNNADGKSPEEYQEIFRHIIGHLHGRVSFARCWGMSDVLELPDDTPYRLGQLILPALKGKLSSVSLVLNPLNWNDDGESWYEPVLNDLTEIDELLEQIVLSMGSAHPENDFVDIASFSVRSVSRRVFRLCGMQLSHTFVAWQSFFEEFSFSNPPSYNLSCTPHGYHVAMLAATSTEFIDTFIERLHKPLSAVAKDEWREFVQQLSSSFNSFVKEPDPNITFLKDLLGWYSQERRMDAFKAASPVIKLCRLYFNKLSRSTVGRPLIFVTPSMEMDQDQLDRFFKHTERAEDSIHGFVDSCERESTFHDVLLKVTYKLEDRMDRLSPFLENYWESLLEENDPDVDREAIAHARQWHESWKQLFSIATDNFLRDTGCKKSRPTGVRGLTGVQWCFLNTMWNSLWKSNRNITVFKYPSRSRANRIRVPNRVTLTL
ncbi:hypothetical protein PSTG_07090 [Puccinia striiformis f. sp. tritici PST-78]|uniref:Uncharacterized protein n=1 Tax=Puccinia striiformis f. sp. tritici PST-78 TaxID=1165861 RepID=A0A0L0VJZ4_9BASI|nr:hypothetical protein PSTG_07090 [Puccinia striiformis f. sp. tritici PST-78]